MSAIVETGRSPLAARWFANGTACVLLWISRTLLALLVAYPLLQAVKASGMVSGPEADAALFQPGSLLLVELLRVGAPLFGVALRTALLFGAIAALVQLLPLALALDLLSFEGTRLSARLRRATPLLARFLVLGGVALLAQAALLLLASLLGSAFKSLVSGGDERLTTLGPLALLALALLGCGWVGAVLDIARAALVQKEQTWSEALVVALTRVREQPLGVFAGGFAVTAASAFATLCGCWLVAHVDLARPGPLGLGLAFAAHQGAVLFAIAWRVRWLRSALAISAGSGR